MKPKKQPYQKYGKQNVEIGFGQNFADGTKRLVNKDGSFNIVRLNTMRSVYVDLIKMSWKQFLLIVVSFYLIVNLVFGAIYFLIGPEQIHVHADKGWAYAYAECVSFSVQTLATVGYGVLNPKTLTANIISSFEALFGILVFAIVTGLSYSRFSKPTARYKFSENAIIAPYQKINSLQVRVANLRNSNLVEIEATFIFSMDVDDNGSNRRVFLNLPLERSKIYYLPLSWTIVHPITEDSPLYNKSPEELRLANIELLVMVKAHDDACSQTIHGSTSYIADEFIYGAKFIPSYYTGDNGNTIFEINKLGKYTEVPLNFTVMDQSTTNN